MSARRPRDERSAPAPCPICGRPAAPAFHPFCSARCADVDLQRWLTDGYALPVDEDEGTPTPEGGPDGSPRPG